MAKSYSRCRAGEQMEIMQWARMLRLLTLPNLSINAPVCKQVSVEADANEAENDCEGAEADTGLETDLAGSGYCVTFLAWVLPCCFKNND